MTFIALRLMLNQPQWDPFLAVNSVGIFMGFRTAMAQGLDDNMRTKLRRMGIALPRPAFIAADHALHTLPALLLLAKLVRNRERVPLVNAIYALTLQSWFSFRQGATLDGSNICTHARARTLDSRATRPIPRSPSLDRPLCRQTCRTRGGARGLRSSRGSS